MLTALPPFSTRDDILDLLTLDTPDSPVDQSHPHMPDAPGRSWDKTPRATLCHILTNTFRWSDDHWDGAEASHALGMILQGINTAETPLTPLLLAAFARAYPTLAVNELGHVQPFESPFTSATKTFFQQLCRLDEGTSASTSTPAKLMLCSRSESSNHQLTYANPADSTHIPPIPSDLGPLTESWLHSVAQEISKWRNGDLLYQLWQKAPRFESASARPGRRLSEAADKLFAQTAGEVTHMIFGRNAYGRALADMPMTTYIPVCQPNNISGLTPCFAPAQFSQLKSYEARFWDDTPLSDQVLLIRRGAHWSDTPYVWAPRYLSYHGRWPRTSLYVHAGATINSSHLMVLDLP